MKNSTLFEFEVAFSSAYSREQDELVGAVRVLWNDEDATLSHLEKRLKSYLGTTDVACRFFDGADELFGSKMTLRRLDNVSETNLPVLLTFDYDEERFVRFKKVSKTSRAKNSDDHSFWANLDLEPEELPDLELVDETGDE